MKYKWLVLVLVALFAFSGCSSEGKAKEVFETAAFEELQNNREHALKLYKEVAGKYPDTEYGKKANERIEILKKELEQK
jgi:hypothetical protein